MNKKEIKILLIMGGNSNEHEVSIVSARNIYMNLSDKYQKDIIYLDKKNNSYKINLEDFLKRKKWKVGDLPKKENKVDLISEIKNTDIVFPALHGKFGEDGEIQKIFEENNVAYIGSSSYSSNICFDKVLTKKEILKSKKNITQAKSMIILKSNFEKDENILKDLKTNDGIKINYPVYIKPARSGSSVGVYKALNLEDLKKQIKLAFNVDDKIIIEEEVNGLECEVAIIEDSGKIKASNIGIILPDRDFYTYDSKYNSEISDTIVTDSYEDLLKIFKIKFNDIDLDDNYIKNEYNKIKEKAIEIFKILKCKDLSRVDFFFTKDGYVFNEINTMPGFTSISMYPMLMKKDYKNISKILDIFVENNIKE